MNLYSRHIVDTIIIGAGMTGITAGNYLQRLGLNVLLLDKGKGIGGRIATRRINFESKKAVFDYGAQYIEKSNGNFANLISSLKEKNIITEWKNLEAGKGSDKFIGIKSMREIAIFLARNLKVFNSTKIIEIGFKEGYWEIVSESGNVFRSKTLLLTLPVPQAIELLDDSKFQIESSMRNNLSAIEYERSIVGLFVADGSINLAGKGGIYFNNSPINFIGDNNVKGINNFKRAITVEMANKFSVENWDLNSKELGRIILDMSKDWITGSIIDSQIHKWKFSRPINPYEKVFEIIDSSKALLIAGDAFGGKNLESAYISGYSAAEKIYNNYFVSEPV